LRPFLPGKDPIISAVPANAVERADGEDNSDQRSRGADHRKRERV